MAGEPERYEFHHEDETHVETNPYLTRVWHRRGEQPTVPAAGTNRRLTVFGSVEVFGRGRIEVVCAGQDSACFARYLTALDARHAATGKEMVLALDNGPCHTSDTSRATCGSSSTTRINSLPLIETDAQLLPKMPCDRSCDAAECVPSRIFPPCHSCR